MISLGGVLNIAPQDNMKIVTELLHKRKKYLFAFSGGVDSLSTMMYFRQLGYNFIAVHINHKMIKEDDDIAKQAQSICKTVNIQLITYINDVITRDSTSKEANARNIRINSFKKVAEWEDLDSFIISHHLGDVCESYLMNCFNGTPEYCPIPWITNFQTFNIIRPFLLTTKKEIIEYSNKNNLTQWVYEDPMNNDLKCKRNHVRKKIIPTIKESYPGIETIARKLQEKHLNRFLLENKACLV